MDEQIVCEVAYETGWINGYNSALEEFAERLKGRLFTCVTDTQQMMIELRIDNLVKEMIKE